MASKKIKIFRIRDPLEIQNPIIRTRAKQSKLDDSIQYIALLKGQEAGYLSFDNKSHIGVGVIYEIYVLEKYRRKGIGSNLLEIGEKLGKENKCKKIIVSPRPFDQTIPENILV